MQTVTLIIPTLEWINGVQVGSITPDAWGKPAEVVDVVFRGVDVKGMAFVGVSQRFGPTSTITNSYKEGQLIRSANLSRYFNSHELDSIEAAMKVDGVTECTLEVG